MRYLKTFSIAIPLVCLFTWSCQNVTVNSGKPADSIPVVGIVHDISDSTLLDIVQRQTFRYFWHYAHP